MAPIVLHRREIDDPFNGCSAVCGEIAPVILKERILSEAGLP